MKQLLHLSIPCQEVSVQKQKNIEDLTPLVFRLGI